MAGALPRAARAARAAARRWRRRTVTDVPHYGRDGAPRPAGSGERRSSSGGRRQGVEEPGAVHGPRAQIVVHALAEDLGGERYPQQETLHAVAPQGAQLLELIGTLDPFRHADEPQ